MSEPQLKYSIAYEVECRDLDDFVRIHLEGFGISWRAIDAEYECNNGTYVSATVIPGDEIEDDLDQDFGRWLLGEDFYNPGEGMYNIEMPSVHHMLQWLCNMGKIAAGRYVVKLDW